MSKDLDKKIIDILIPMIKTKGKNPKDIDVLKIGDLLLVKPSERNELKGILKNRFKKDAVELAAELRKEREKKWKK